MLYINRQYGGPQLWTVSESTESNARYLRHGLLQFTLSTTCPIGRLTQGLFRVSAGSIFRVPAGLQGLTRIHPQRHLESSLSRSR